MGTATKKKTKAEPFTLSDAEATRYLKGMKSIPVRVEILRHLIREAWEIVCYMTEAGLPLRSSSPEQAALTIAGCAYAAWHRTIIGDDMGPRSAVEIVEGFCQGIMWAMWQGDGMPSTAADDYTFYAERSDSVLDRMVPVQLLGKHFSDTWKDGKIALKPVGVAPVNPDAWDACAWTHRPNILTATFEEVKDSQRRARLRANARRKRKAKKPKDKPRAK